jgi:hypothetical protein
MLTALTWVPGGGASVETMNSQDTSSFPSTPEVGYYFNIHFIATSCALLQDSVYLSQKGKL